ncbi:MAG: hypothetical protein Q8M76_17595, partial [Spirochaetaceae bacterium]|nr:hypothetical protein [Spirochaetaceae bacterium]
EARGVVRGAARRDRSSAEPDSRADGRKAARAIAAIAAPSIAAATITARAIVTGGSIAGPLALS